MRLITKALLWYFLLASVVFGIGGIITFVLVKEAVEKETDYELNRNLRQIVRAIAKGQPIDLLENNTVKISPLNQPPVEEDRFYSDTLVYHARTERMENFRKLVALRNVEESPYRIEIIDIYFEQDDIIEVVSKILLRLFLVFSLVFLIGSILIFRGIFHPFEELLTSIDRWNLKSNAPLDLPSTNTKELQKLNKFLKRMTNKARQDYQNLKEFTENASHEMQTPLAIARGKLEILQEDSSLTAEQMQLIQSAQFSLDKLSKLGKALTLLTKIENLEFETTKNTNVSDITQRISLQFEELARLKGLQLHKNIQADVELQIDPLLADIMITNLLKNALQHNIKNGRIEVELDEHQLKVKNTGPKPSAPMHELFERFKKSNGSNGSLGLGLAIVKKIGDVHQMSVTYNFEENLHEVSVRF